LGDQSINHLIEYIDYITLFELKYTSKKFKEKIKKSGLDRILDLRNIKIQNENTTIYKILKKHGYLKSIIIEFRKLNDTHLMQIGSSEKINENLEEINLNGCHNITDKGLINLANKCPYLKKLEIYWIPNITDEGLRPILENCRNLKYLNISGLKNVTVEGSLKLINTNLKNLEHIVRILKIK
jgi:F-box and leucine-rich repeat protein 2/20